MSTDTTEVKANLPATRAGELQPVADRPSFLGEVVDRTGTEGLGRIVRPSFLKIVQKQSADELLAKYPIGSIILTPDMIPVTDGGVESAARIIPIMFYTEYCKWAPMALKGIEPMIVARSFDPNSEVGVKSASPATWTEKHPNPQYANDPKFNYRYCEHLNYIVKLVDDDLMQTDPVLLSFVKTNYSVGQRLAKLALARKAQLFAGVYEIGTRTRENASNSWKVFTIENCSVTPWVASEEMFARLKELHLFYLDLMKSQMLRTEYDPDAVGGEDASASRSETGTY